MDFKEKRLLVNHLKRKNICMPIENDILTTDLLEEIYKKEGSIECKDCKRMYKNSETLRKHKCKSKNIEMDNIEKIKKDLKLKLRQELKEEIMKELKDKVSNTIINNIDNSTTNNITNNTLNVQLNCFMDTSGKPIEYLLQREDIMDRVLGWIKSKTGLLEYIDEKFYNPDHPENHVIKKGKNEENIKLHIRGKWKELDNLKASDLILTNVGNDFMSYIENIKEDEEEYKSNKKVLKKFESDVMVPLEWGIELSEDSENLVTKTIVKNERGEYVYLEDVMEKDKKLEVTNDVITHIHNKY